MPEPGEAPRTLVHAGFDEKVLECVDRGLGSLGDSTKRAVYWHMETLYGQKREDVPSKPQEFAKSLAAMFGAGASILERLIVGEIQLDFKISGKAQTFETAVREARMKWSRNESITVDNA